MKKDIHYLSFGASEPHELNRQVGFCQFVADYLQSDFHFYCFIFSDEEHVAMDGVQYILLSDLDQFFEVFESKMQRETIVFNHAFFYSKIKSYLGSEYNTFIYHKLDLEYLLMKKIGLDEADYTLHLTRELYLMDHCDWMYTHSETLMEYVQENHGYHQHKCSIIPHFPLSFKKNVTPEIDLKFFEKGVHFLHIGPVSNRGVKHIKKILAVQANRMTVISDDVRTISRQGFMKDPRFRLLPFKLNVLQLCLDHADYGLIKPKSNVLGWIRAQNFVVDYLSHGMKVLIPKDVISDTMKDDDQLFMAIESIDFKLPKITESEKEQRKIRAHQKNGVDETHNSIKFRNLKSLHLGLVNKR